MEHTKPMEIINVRTVSQPAFDPEDVDVFVRVLNGEELPHNLQIVPQWEQEVQQRIDTMRYWLRVVAVAAVTFTILGFSIFGMISAVMLLAK